MGHEGGRGSSTTGGLQRRRAEASSGFFTVADQAASLRAIALAGVLAGAAYLTVSLWWSSTSDASVGVPVLYATAVIGAALCAFLLRLRADILSDPATRWLAAGFATAGLAGLAQGLVVVELARVPFVPSASGAAALYLIWHLALPMFVLGSLLAPTRAWLRRSAIALVVVAIAAALLEPAGLPLPPLVDDGNRFTTLYRLVLAALAVFTVTVAALGAARFGRRPSRVQAWVLVALVLAGVDVLVAGGATRFFEAIWWSSAVLRAATFAAPALGLLGDNGRLLRLLHHHEQALAERLQTEVELATATVGRPAPDAGARARIEGALEPGAIEIVYQPIYSLATGDLAAVEALARFVGPPDRTPDRWFTEAHAVGLGNELELAAIAAALRDLRSLPPTVAVSLNASPGALVEPELDRLLGDHPDRQLVVEVTEHAAVRDYEQLVAAIAPLRQRGVRLAIDDAGAGFASMRHIVRLVPDIIKLDISLTRDIHLDPVGRALAASLVDFSDQIGALLVAEGIEHPDELRACQELGVHAAQGYLLGRPSPLPVRPHSDVVLLPSMQIARPTARARSRSRGVPAPTDRSLAYEQAPPASHEDLPGGTSRRRAR